MNACGIRVPGAIRSGWLSQRTYQSYRTRWLMVERSGPRVPVFGMPAMSWHEMQPIPDLPTMARPAAMLGFVSGSLWTASSGTVPSRAARAVGRWPTFAGPYCGIRSCIHGRARWACVSTPVSHDVRALWPTPVRTGGRTSSAFSLFSRSRICSASSRPSASRSTCSNKAQTKQ